MTIAKFMETLQNQRVGKGARNASPTLVNRTLEVFKMTNTPIRLKSDLTQAELKRRLSYDPDSGIFRWVMPFATKKAGEIAGSISHPTNPKHGRGGYVAIGFNRSIYYAHRLAWLYVHGEWPSQFLDHIDGDRSNNRIANLRECTAQQNAQARHLRTGKTSQYMGVTWSKVGKKWQAAIIVDGRSIYLGLFHSESDAAEAYRTAKMMHHPFSTARRSA